MKKMKTNKDKTSNKKFDLEKMKVAKLKNINSINGGYVLGDDPILTTAQNGGSSLRCKMD
jgi:hypothetical protein